jgi:zinc transporter ZupT
MGFGLIIAISLAFFAAFFGGVINLSGKSIGAEGLKLTNGFSAGLLITIALAHMLPEADLEKNYLYAVTGFGLFYLIEGFTRSGSCSDISCEREHSSSGMIAYSGFSFHALVDGIAMGVGFSSSASLGILIAIAIMIHKAPIGFSLSSILLSKGYKKAKIVVMILLFSLLTPLGALVSNISVSVGSSILTPALAFSGGTFLHISISELLPDVHRERNRTILFYVLAGIIVGLIPKLFHVL